MTEAPPSVPVQLALKDCVTHFVAVKDEQGEIETMVLVLTPVVRQGDQLMVVVPQVCIPFGKVGWERFKRDVAADGATSGILLGVPGMIPG